MRTLCPPLAGLLLAAALAACSGGDDAPVPASSPDTVSTASATGAARLGADLSASASPACGERAAFSMYGQASLLSDYRDAGMGLRGPHPGPADCEFLPPTAGAGFDRMHDAGAVKAYPQDGQVGVARTYAPATERPDPMPDLGAALVGQPVLASMRAFDAIGPFTVTGFTLQDDAGNRVPARLIAGKGTAGAGLTPDPNDLLAAGDVYLVPISPLLAGTTYRAEFTGTAGAHAHARSWVFTTAP